RVGEDPVRELCGRHAEDVARGEDAAVGAGVDHRLAGDHAGGDGVPVGVHVRQRTVAVGGVADAGAGQPVGGVLPGGAAVHGTRAAEVSAHDGAVGILRVDADREVVPALAVAHVERPAVDGRLAAVIVGNGGIAQVGR